MGWNRYVTAKAKLLNDETICSENRDIFRQFLDHREYKLKRINGLAKLDANSIKTVYSYVTRLRTVNRWFGNKPWAELTKDDIKQVYDAIEDGRITTLDGRPFRDRETLYTKVLLGKPFELAGKKGIVREALEFRAKPKPTEVRFIREAAFRQIVDTTIKPEHKAFLWLAWDIGENATSLLRLRKCDCTRQINEHTKEPEYTIILRREILKRTRTPRTEITNYKETVQSLDLILAQLSENEMLFAFGARMTMKVLDRATRITAAKCIPGGQKVTLKDLRSSMACDLLSKGWTTDEVNQRLGHRPSSREG